jgi:hypothetical protein
MGLLPGTQRRDVSELKWERLGAYSDVRIQIITMLKKGGGGPSGHNTEQMKRGRTEKRKMC